VVAIVLPRDFHNLPFAQAHQNNIHGQPMKPAEEGGFSAESVNLTENLQEGLLGQVLGISLIFCHAQAQTIDPSIVSAIDSLEGCSVALLCLSNGFFLRDVVVAGFSDSRRLFR
jgi:hypothetical protein